MTILAILSLSARLLAPVASQRVSLPLSLSPRVLNGTEQTCPPDEVRQTTRFDTAQDIRTLLRDNIICPTAQTQANPAASCSEISAICQSDYYWVRSSNGTAVQIYCDMERVCGCNGTGGWARVAHLNMTDTSQQCPSAWRLITTPKRTCGRTNTTISSGGLTGGGCSSEYFSTRGITYNRVCGRVVAYQKGQTDAFAPYVDQTGDSIDGAYVDGVSITHGQVSRTHIWTFASAILNVLGGPVGRIYDLCPCTNTGYTWPYTTPPWVGNNYFCETANLGPGTSTTTFYAGDPLWDGEGCPSTSTCCQFNNPPWFCRQLPRATTDDLEVRICGNQHTNEEDNPVELVELYVQ